MTNYLGTAGIQSFSIAIANGNATGTASVNSPSGLGALIRQGETATDTANVNDSMCRLSRSGGTVTATRGATGSSQSTAVNGTLIDGDSTNLFQTYQEGTIAMTTAQTSNTATNGTAVTDGDTVDCYLGASVVTSSTSWSNNQCVITRSGTTVTATKQFAGTAVTAGFSTLEHQPGVLNSASQKVSDTTTPSNASSRTITITSIDTTKTILFFSGMYGNGSASSNTTFQRGALTSATQITVNTNGNSSVALRYCCVVAEYATGVLAVSVQRGTISLSSAASGTATPTSSDTTKGFLNYLGHSASPTGMSPSTQLMKGTQTDATTITATFNASSTGGYSWEIALYTTTGTVNGVATWSASASLAAVGKAITKGIATWSPAASFAPKGSAKTNSVATWSASAALAAVGASAKRGVATWSASASLAAVGKTLTKGVATFSPSASLTAVGKSIDKGVATFSPSASLAARGASLDKGVATWSASASLAATGRSLNKGVATFTAAASLLATGHSLNKSAVTLSAAANLSAIGRPIVSSAFSMSASASLQAAGSAKVSGRAIMTASASFAAVSSSAIATPAPTGGPGDDDYKWQKYLEWKRKKKRKGKKHDGSPEPVSVQELPVAHDPPQDTPEIISPRYVDLFLERQRKIDQEILIMQAQQALKVAEEEAITQEEEELFMMGLL